MSLDISHIISLVNDKLSRIELDCEVKQGCTHYEYDERRGKFKGDGPLQSVFQLVRKDTDEVITYHSGWNTFLDRVIDFAKDEVGKKTVDGASLKDLYVKILDDCYP